MINYKQLAGEKITDLKPYLPGKPMKEVERESGITNVVKLASNENPYGCSPKAIQALKDFLPEITRYPLGDSFYLRQAISEKYNVGMDNILCGAGSDEIIQLLYIAFLHGDAMALAPMPSFSEYELLARSLRCGCKWVDTNKDFTTNLDAILKAVDKNTRFIMLANPNNPTGTAFSEKELIAFLDKLSPNIMVAMDEAYIEFADRDDLPDTIKLMKKYKNLMTLRTFSKAYGLASVRCGFMIAHPECIDVVQRVRPPFNVSMPGQVMAEAAIKDDEFVKKIVKLNLEEKNYIYGRLEKAKITYIPTQANFMLVKTGNGKQLFEKLLSAGIIVRFLGGEALKDYIRISIGTRDENKRLLDKLTEDAETAGLISSFLDEAIS